MGLRNRTPRGEYSTIVTGDSMVETMWFSNDGKESVTISRSSLAAIARQHIESDPHPEER